MFIVCAYAQSAAYIEFWAKLGRGEHVTGFFDRIGKGGKSVSIEATYNPVFDPEGRVLKVIKLAVDARGRLRAIQSLGDGLAALAENNLAAHISEPLDPVFEKLRIDFNTALGRFRDLVGGIAAKTDTLGAGTDRIAQGANDLSERTEQQAGSLTETAAALDQITTTVSMTANGAKYARGIVTTTKVDAEHSRTVVHDAVSAMNEITKSSEDIGPILGVVDEIAFQTNFLALNTGVETARAGDAGRGFAVVATEVRALAQRSAEAVREIKAIVSTSARIVGVGVKLIGETGETGEALGLSCPKSTKSQLSYPISPGQPRSRRRR